MPVYCDESGGVGAGVMVLAGVSLGEAEAEAVVQRFRDVTGLRGELKGSRITLPERAFLIELLMRSGGRVMAAGAFSAKVATSTPDGRPPQDIRLYARLLETVVDAALPQSGGCIDLVIDDGRYDARLNGLLRDDVQKSLGQWGKASLADSKRVAGVQIADVVANSFFQIGTGSRTARRVEALLAPFRTSGAIRLIEIETI